MKIQLNDLTVNYTERGAPNGLPAVFVHGFPFSHAMWEPQMRALPNNIRAIAYDTRGHGLTDTGDGQFTIDMMVDDLIALLDHLVIDRAVLVGLSMGGYIVLRCAERHPDRVRALVLADTRSEADGNEAKVKRTASLKAVKRTGVHAFAEGFVKAVFAEESFRSHPESVDFIRGIIEANSPLGVCGNLLAIASRTDTTASLAAIAVPTLILCGEADKVTPPEASKAMHEKIKGSTLHIIPQAAHMSNLENEQVFNERLNAFLATVGRSAS